MRQASREVAAPAVKQERLWGRGRSSLNAARPGTRPRFKRGQVGKKLRSAARAGARGGGGPAAHPTAGPRAPAPPRTYEADARAGAAPRVLAPGVARGHAVHAPGERGVGRQVVAGQLGAALALAAQRVHPQVWHRGGHVCGASARGAGQRRGSESARGGREAGAAGPALALARSASQEPAAGAGGRRHRRQPLLALHGVRSLRECISERWPSAPGWAEMRARPWANVSPGCRATVAATLPSGSTWPPGCPAAAAAAAAAAAGLLPADLYLTSTWPATTGLAKRGSLAAGWPCAGRACGSWAGRCGGT